MCIGPPGDSRNGCNLGPTWDNFGNIFLSFWATSPTHSFTRQPSSLQPTKPLTNQAFKQPSLPPTKSSTNPAFNQPSLQPTNPSTNQAFNQPSLQSPSLAFFRSSNHPLASAGFAKRKQFLPLALTLHVRSWLPGK